jgi:hypothetical protein
VELPNGDLSRSLFSVGVSGDVAAGVPGVSAGGVSGVVVAVVPGGVAAGGLPDIIHYLSWFSCATLLMLKQKHEPITIALIPTILLVLIKRRSLDGRENSFVSLKRRKLILLQMLWLWR